MKLIVFGATGSVGRHLVSQALAQNHQVTAFARHPESVALDHPNLTRRAGDVLDPATVEHAVAGHDAALVVLGDGRKGRVRAAGTRNVIAALERHGVRRLVCESTLGAGDSRPLLTFFWKRIMFGLVLRAVYADHQMQERMVQGSALDWTIVRPGAFTDGPATGAYRHGFAPTAKGLTLKISRADVAGFMLRQLSDDRYLRQAPGLSY